MFMYLAEIKLVDCSPNFSFLLKTSCQPFSSALCLHKPSWISNGLADVLVKLKTEFPPSFFSVSLMHGSLRV